MEPCTFKPQIISKFNNGINSSIHSRINENVTMKQKFYEDNK